MESYASRTIDLKPLVLFPRDGYTMFTPRQSPRGLILRSRGAYVYMYIRTYIYMCVYIYVYMCIISHQEERGECPSIESPSAVVPINASPPRVSHSVVLFPSLSLDDFDPLGYGQFFSRISSEVSKHAKARARWTRRAN